MPVCSNECSVILTSLARCGATQERGEALLQRRGNDDDDGDQRTVAYAGSPFRMAGLASDDLCYLFTGGHDASLKPTWNRTVLKCGCLAGSASFRLADSWQPTDTAPAAKIIRGARTLSGLDVRRRPVVLWLLSSDGGWLQRARFRHDQAGQFF